MNRLSELIEKWRNEQVSKEEFHELRQLLSTREGRVELCEDFQFDHQLMESVQLAKRTWQQEQRAPLKTYLLFQNWLWDWRRVWAPVVVVLICSFVAFRLAHRPKAGVLAYNLSSFGKVHVVNGGKHKPLRVGDPIFSNSKIETCEIGRASIRWAGDTTQVEIGEKSKVSFARQEGNTILTLDEGELELLVARQPENSKLIVQTVSGQVEVIGTRLKVTLNNGQMAVKVREGSVKVTSSKLQESAMIYSGQQVHINNSGKFKKGVCGENCASMESQWEWVENEDARVSYQGEWVRDRMKNKSVHKSAEGMARMNLKFHGEAFKLIGDKNFCGGSANIFIDGISHGTIYFNAAAPGFRSLPVFATNGLSNTEHTVSLVCNGDGWVYLDAVSVKAYCGEEK